MPFARRAGATEEDDGYLLAFMTNVGTGQSDAHIYDARDIEQGPIGRLGLPERIPAGFHAAWMPGEDLGRSG